MIVLSIIGIISLVIQICIMHLVRRHRNNIPPPPWIEYIMMKRSEESTDKSNKQLKYKPKAVSKEMEMVNNQLMDKWMEEKELMLGEQSLGLTTLGRDGKCFVSTNQYLPRSREQQEQKYKTLQTRITMNNQTTSSTYNPYNSLPNGTSARNIHQNNRYQKPFKETSLIYDANGSEVRLEDTHGTSGGESFDSGCHSATKNSPDVTISTTKSIKDCQWKKCIKWFDRAVSLIISAAVILTIMIFTIIFLAT